MDTPADSDSRELTLGVVLTLDADASLRPALLEALSMRPDVTFESTCGQRLPIALQTRSGEDRAALDSLQDLPGVLFCDVVYAHFHDSEDRPDELTAP